MFRSVASPTLRKRELRYLAALLLRTFAVGPIGISIKISVEPAATFLDKTEATSCLLLSKSRARSIWTRTSSTGLKSTDPPQTIQPPSLLTTFFIALTERSTGAKTSMVSAVPAGEVMALEDVFGILRP